MTITADSAVLDVHTWEEPQQLTARGTLFLLTGRGETPEVYQRFAGRLAADAYLSSRARKSWWAPTPELARPWSSPGRPRPTR
jgi:hypothetical protein